MTNTLLSIDAWAIRRVYQPVVDLVGNSPKWWVEVCAVVSGLAHVGAWAGSDTVHILAAVFHAILASLIVLACRLEIVYEALKFHPIFRALILLMYGASCVATTILFVIAPLDAGMMARLVCRAGDMAYLSVFYFAACEEPPPPKHQYEPEAA